MKNDAALWQRGMEWGKELLAPPPRSHAEAYRHELKYLISYADKAELAVRMAPVLHLDPHAKQGGYFIRSLYFDDYWNTAYEEKDAGVLLAILHQEGDDVPCLENVCVIGAAGEDVSSFTAGAQEAPAEAGAPAAEAAAPAAAASLTKSPLWSLSANMRTTTMPRRLTA